MTIDLDTKQEKRKHLSPSSISQYVKCGEQYRRVHIEGDKIPPPIVMHVGTGVHKGSEENFRQKIDTRKDLSKKIITDAAISGFEDSVKNQGLWMSPDEETIGKAKLIETGKVNIQTFSTLYRNDVAPKYQPVATEEFVTVPVVEIGIDIVGRIDVRTERGEIVDLKTSAKSKNQDEIDNNPQLTFYGLLFAAKFGNKHNPFLIMENLVNTQIPKTQTLTTERRKEDYEALMNQILRVDKGIKAGVFPFAYGQMGAWWCSAKMCGFWKTCQGVPAHKR